MKLAPGRVAALLGIVLVAASRAEGPAERTLPPPRGWVWTATRDGAQIDLVGTMHAGPKDDDRLPPEVLRRWPLVDRLAIEVDTSDPAKMAATVARVGLYSADEVGLDGRLGPDLRQRLEKLLGAVSPPMWRMKPWMLVNTVVTAHLERWGCSSRSGVDALLRARARADGKPLIELETIEAQLRVFDAAPEAVQIAYLDETVRSLENGEARQDVETILAAYRAGDIAALERLCEEFASHKGRAERYFHRRLIVDRNASMTAAIERLARDGGRAMVAVGALHFPGPKGILAGLRGRGFEIEPAALPAPAAAGALR